MHYFYGMTQKGKRGQKNKDCFLIDDFVVNCGFKKKQSKKNGFVLSVADGLGSALYGDIASQYILTQFSNNRKLLSRALAITMIDNANSYLLKKYQGNATTVFTMICGSDEKILIFHVGDTRAYKLTKRNLIQLTNDHTEVQKLVDWGVIGENMRIYNNKKHIVSQCLGYYPKICIDIYPNTFEHGEMLLLTSDGIHDYLSQEHMESILRKSINIETNANGLIQAAVQQGSTDDLTVVIVKYI
ncbi:MAG: protein phosphatase 2C domain-containing protein [Campylobacteraceae bacterium]|jgi:protein phosphatase|nr:protein phosphatase 2C domain-containing protein [Campylobacteraceae bacterium]